MPRLRPIRALAFAAALLAPGLAVAETVMVEVDRAKILRLDAPAATVILGNPSIADALVQDRSMLVVTGKSFGSTNLIVLDQNGGVLDEIILQVQAPRDSAVVTVQRGVNRVSLSCAPNCERTLAVGDTPDSYNELSSQITSRIGISTDQAGSN